MRKLGRSRARARARDRGKRVVGAAAGYQLIKRWLRLGAFSRVHLSEIEAAAELRHLFPLPLLSF